MSSDIITVLNFETEYPNGKFYLVRSTGEMEPTFITSCILEYQIRKRQSIVLITFHQMLDHYHNIALRMGFNLQQNIEKGNLRVINPTEGILNYIFGDKPFNLEETLQSITKNVECLMESFDSVCIYIDELIHLLDLGLKLQEINCFVRKLLSLLQKKENVFLFINSHVASKKDISDLLTNLLEDMASSVIEVNPLVTGRSKEVSGHLKIKHPSHCFNINKKMLFKIDEECYHFKLFDRGVKLFSPGTI